MTIKVGMVASALLWVAGAALATCSDPGAERVDIYPTAAVLPENTLRMYIYYPRPMAAEEGLRNVRFLDETGTPLEGVFLETREDLWSPDRRRLTLLFDPGRVKTGLEANDALGRALVSGRSYALEISGAALDAEGCPLGRGARYAFTVGPADLEPPDPASWDISQPKANSVETLTLGLGSPHDHLSMAFRLRVFDAQGNIVAGAVALGQDEDSWAFTPRSAWAEQRYTIAIDASLEDLAGNRPGVLFDRPLNQAPAPWDRALYFTPKP